MNKYLEYNQAQTATGSPLKTLNGSTVKRSKYGVGKEIGGGIYAHRDYIDIIIPEDILHECHSMLTAHYSSFSWNTFKFDHSSGVVLFQEGPDFNSSPEPRVGWTCSVNPNKGVVSMRNFNQIWHHKWLWVTNDYTGFDVRESWEWSKYWLSILPVPADGSNQHNWLAQLDRYGIIKE